MSERLRECGQCLEGAKAVLSPGCAAYTYLEGDGVRQESRDRDGVSGITDVLGDVGDG